MASVLQKLLHPLFSGPPEPPRNKVTVVGVGQVGMACAVTILLRVRVPAFTFAPVNPFPAGLAGCLQTVPRLLTLSQCVDRLMNTPAVTHGSFPPPLAGLQQRHQIGGQDGCWLGSLCWAAPTIRQKS